MNRAERRKQKKRRRGNADVDAQFHEAVAQREAGNAERAARLCDGVLRAQPDRAEALNLKGVLLADAGRHDMAVTRFAEATARDPANAAYRCNLGAAHHALEDFEAAERGYRAALDRDPRNGPAAAGLGRLSEARGLPRDALEYYRAAMENHPGELDALCGLARVLGQQGRNEEALGYFRRAIAAEPRLAEAQDQMFAALREGVGKQIPAWHFSMLADNERNAAYQRAIDKHVGPSTHVLDIGTGSSLLALMAARAGAAHVTACELSEPIAEAARHVVAENGFGNTIDVIAKASTALRISHDMAARANLLVSEILDSGLTGEGVVKFVRHARREVLTPDARIIPCGATVKAVLVALPRLRPVNPVASIRGFDLSAFGRFQNLDDYASIDLTREPCTRYSDEFPVLSFDFTNLPPEASRDHPYEQTIEVAITENGSFHAIAYWFDFHLDDAITVSSGPRGGVVHWGQAVQFFATDVAVRKGERVALTMTFDETKIRWRLDDSAAR